ncbi:hypothetical protein BM528_00415 [Alteromonas sp. RW2A1]|uniref:hypothetical protein n=1 Tax=Alteromonas sp. RW2A1 TaxID=1917158 RepID=UPI0009043940|nr:hypothetical protein [Alteromonas sp. RW2A1]APE04424.1 hypothetical protein BM528_00415 [Alteromonas sp. RW2A1]
MKNHGHIMQSSVIRMISEETQLNDNLDDEVNSLLEQINSIDSWTAKKFELKAKLLNLLKKKRYIVFKGPPKRYLAYRIGSSYLYDVPMYQRGVLSKFRGKRARIICVGSGRYTREYMAGVVGKTPKERLIQKFE